MTSCDNSPREARCPFNHLVSFLLTAILVAQFSAQALQIQEWMTPAEIEKFRDEQDLAKRTGLYMNAAKLRLEQAAERLSGKNSAEGDPLEFHSVTDLIWGCRSAIRAAMLGIQDQVTYKKAESVEVIKALKELKSTTEGLLPELERVQKLALEKRDEALYKAVKECAQYADSAARGSKDAIEKMKKEDRAKGKP
jgi:hypothetical protein